MSAVRISINTDNDAFWPMVGPELADALRMLADQIEGAEDIEDIDGIVIHDTNGNTVGRLQAVSK